jgi:Leucine-rich repeat (LRR) protein
MQHVTETADAEAPPSEKQQALDDWHVDAAKKFKDNLSEFETTSKISNRSAERFAHVISKCPKLKKLSISGNDSEFLRRFASGLGKCPELERLDLSKNNFKDPDVDSLWQVIEQCPKLVSLTLLDNAIGPEAFETLQKRLKDSHRGQTLQVEVHRSP